MRFAPILFIVVSVAACSTSTTTSTTTSMTTGTQGPVSSDGGIPPELADHDIRQVSVGDRTLTLAIADSPSLRAEGLMHVTDLGSLDGMLFYWRHEATGGFWMKDTVIPLDIVWFDADGAFVGRASMVPCITDDCPSYEPEGDVDYRFGIEANPGDLDWVDGDTVLRYSD